MTASRCLPRRTAFLDYTSMRRCCTPREEGYGWTSSASIPEQHQFTCVAQPTGGYQRPCLQSRVFSAGTLDEAGKKGECSTYLRARKTQKNGSIKPRLVPIVSMSP